MSKFKTMHRLLCRYTAGLLTGICLLSLPAAEAGATEVPTLNPQTQEAWRFIPTTMQNVILTFGGLSKEAPLTNILAAMDKDGMSGTFFVTEQELKRNDSNIRLILAHGQKLGIGIAPIPKGGTQEEYTAQIARIKKILAERYGVETNLIRVMAQADDLAVIQQAAAASGGILMGQGINVVQSKHKDAQRVEQVMGEIFGRWTTSLDRGEIVYLRTDFYTNDDLAAGLLRAIKQQKVDNIAYASFDDDPKINADNDSAYRMTSAQEVLQEPDLLWAYPDVASLPAEQQPEYGRGLMDEKAFEEEFLRRYIGAPEVNDIDRMAGFSRSGMDKADHTGVVKSVRDNTIFLTFDDWGKDDSINQLLYVLRKHNVRATFFIITKNMPTNPNLLRAIAADGNEIASHTDHHVAMTENDEKGRPFFKEDIDTYRAQVAESYDKLVAVCGDMRIQSSKGDGYRPALTRLMRPPTLAISREGIKALLESGFTYIVNGYGSTEDYASVSMQSLVGIMDHIIHDERGNVRAAP